MLRSQLLRVRVLVHRRLLSDGHSGPDLPKGTSVAYFVFLTGAFAGGIGSLVGMGGAFVALPVLTGYFGLAQHIAHGTSMAAVLATAIGGCAAYLQREPELLQKIQQIDRRQHIPAQIGNVHLVTVAAVALTSSLTVILGARLGQATSIANLKKGMAIFTLAIAPTVPLRGYLKDISGHRAPAAATEVVDLEHMDRWKHQIIKPMIVGAFSGVLSGIFGVGGGALTVPALSMTTDLDHQVILGTSLTVMIPTAIAGSIANIRHGTMRAAYAAPLAAGCLLGSYVGGTYGKHLDGGKTLQYTFAGVMGVLGLRMLRQTMR